MCRSVCALMKCTRADRTWCVWILQSEWRLCVFNREGVSPLCESECRSSRCVKAFVCMGVCVCVSQQARVGKKEQSVGSSMPPCDHCEK